MVVRVLPARSDHKATISLARVNRPIGSSLPFTWFAQQRRTEPRSGRSSAAVTQTSPSALTTTTAVVADNQPFLLIVRCSVNPNHPVSNMTNASSGSKRAWDGPNDTESHKRPREDARDWRDVHLDSPRRKGPGRRDTDDLDRRGGDRRPSRGDYRPRSRDRDHDRRTPRDYSGGKDKRDDRDRDRERDRSRGSRRDDGPRRDNSRGSDRRRDDHHRSRRPSPPHPRDKRVIGGSDPHSHATKVEDEKEEGE